MSMQPVTLSYLLFTLQTKQVKKYAFIWSARFDQVQD